MNHRTIRYKLVIALTLAILLNGTVVLSQEPLKLGVHPYLSSSELIARYAPLAEHLAQVLAQPVIIEVSSSYDAHIEKIGNGTIDIAYLGPASYVKLVDKFGKFPILGILESGGKKTFQGYIVTRKDSSIRTLDQLRGKRLAFGDPDSTMSHLVPRYLLLKSGIDVRLLAEYRFVANHENIALGVLSGNFDAGAVKEETFRAYEPKGLRAIAVSPPISDHVFVASKDLPPATVRAVSKTLAALKVTPEGRRILTSMRKDVTSIVPCRDADYDNLREIISSLRKAGIEQ